MSNILGFLGLMSSGKGVCSTRFLREQKSINPKRIISNCYLNDKDVTILANEELVDKVRLITQGRGDTTFFDNSYLYLQELHTIIDSRRSGSGLNTFFTMFLTQLGKRDCFIIYDSQLSGQIDLRMREFTPKRIICTRYIAKDGQWQLPDFGTPRKYKGPIAILQTLNYTDLDGKEVYRPFKITVPTQEDFDYYQTEEMILLNRDKYLSKR